MHLSEHAAWLVHTLSDFVVLFVLLATCVAAFVFYKIFKSDFDIRE